MKTYIKYLAISIFAIFIVASCNLDEEPVSYAGEKLFDNEAGAQSVLNGVYSSLTAFNYYGADYHHLLNMGSGLFATDRVASYNDIAALNPIPSLNFVTNVWKAMYQTIGRANDLIVNMEALQWTDTATYNDILGQAYFIRSLTYFSLVRTYGGVPLVTGSVSPDETHNPRATVEEVYTQILHDAQIAEMLLPIIGDGSAGRPDKSAVYMLLAKVYIQQAGNSTDKEYWQLAYDQAIKAYGSRSLVSNFTTLWYEETGSNTEESIFEIQSNEENTLRLHQLFTPKNGSIGLNTWSRFRANLEVYDLHDSIYPTDPRIASTFITEYIWYNSKDANDTKIQVTYPDPVALNRGKKASDYPYCFKYYQKDHSTSITYGQNQSFIILRYAELLLMLAEIENELNGPANAYQYVNEVLARARNSYPVDSIPSNSLEPADWVGLTQDSFREAIMNEYQFELYEEGDDFFRVRRRGYDWFKTHVLIPHNTHTWYGDFSGNIDIEYPDNDRIMLMPISSIEIATNNMISADNQNPGY